MRNGIIAAGNALVDIIYNIERYPGAGELTTIQPGFSRATGGALCNTGMDLAKLDPQMKVIVIGRVGEDRNGDYILEELSAFPNIDTTGMIRVGETSFTAVMADMEKKTRTFFQFRGANTGFCETDIDLENLNADIFHIGYILLLDALDEEDREYGTKMARLLSKVQKKGIRTSVDLVSESGNRFQNIVTPALKYTDYCIINEIEAQKTTGILLVNEEGGLLRENFLPALKKLKELGVSTWACIHCQQGAFGLDENDQYCEVSSLSLTEGYIRGTTGAGDAFCAGVLYGAWKEMPLHDAIHVGTAVAACSLREEDATSGVQDLDSCMAEYIRCREVFAQKTESE